jgi:hypothetical protein
MTTLPGDTKIENLGLSADEIKILTPTDRELTKDDLLKLRDISRANPAATDDKIRGEFNTFLQSEGKQQLTVVDFESLIRATASQVLSRQGVPGGTDPGCCCTPCCSCCSASSLTQPVVQ